MESSEKIRILAADDMEAHQRRLKRILSDVEDMELVGTANTGGEAVKLAEELTPDVILMDIEMENATAGITAASEIHKFLPDSKIIMLTVHDSDEIVFQAFQTELSDYLIKTLPAEEIIKGIRDAYHETSIIRAEIAAKIKREFRRIKSNEESLLFLFSILSKLTISELAVLKLICEGKTKHQIADERVVEYDTIKKQITSILRKFSLPSTADVAELVNKSGVLDKIF